VKPTTSVHHVKYGITDRPRWDYEMRDGKLDGTSRTFHYGGSLASTGTYRAGLKHGVFRYYDEDERMTGQTLFINGEERWSSADPGALPPKSLVEGLELGDPVIEEEERLPSFSKAAPGPLFTSLDRTTPLTRGGLVLGVVGVGEDTVVRSEVFAHVPIGAWGAYAQVGTSTLLRRDGNLSGRRTLDLGGTRALALGGPVKLSLRAGLLAPVGNDDEMGFVASSAAAPLRATDVVGSLPSTVAARTSASVSAVYRRVVLQADGGLDWAIGGRDSAVDPLARLNVGVGFGMKSLMVSIELANVMRLLEPSEYLMSLSAGPTLWLGDVWLNGTMSVSNEAETGVLIGGGVAF
jgi:hypothetical protein